MSNCDCESCCPSEFKRWLAGFDPHSPFLTKYSHDQLFAFCWNAALKKAMACKTQKELEDLMEREDYT